MEGFAGLRLGVIFALLLGSVWVLIPTFVAGDAEETLAAQAAEVSGPDSSRRAIDLDVAFEATQGEPAALAAALGARLTAAQVPHQRVTAEGSTLVAKLEAGGRREVVEALSARPGVSGLVAPSLLLGGAIADPGAPDLTRLPAGLADALGTTGVDLGAWSKRLPEIAGVALPDGVDAVEGLGTVTLGESPTAEISSPAGEPWALVVLDRLVVAAVVPATGNARLFPLVQDPVLLAVLASGALPGVLAVVPPVAVPVAQTAEIPAATRPDPLPAWLRNALPNSKINLGLDLQGGIDLTLQVELDDAVQGQVSRDAARVRDLAVQQKLAIDKVTAERSDPLIWITSSLPIGEVQAFARSSIPEYPYVSSEGNAHGFEMGERLVAEVEDAAVAGVLETLRKRVDETGVKEPSIVKKGGGRINVQLPGKVDLQQAIDALGTTAVLEFRLVDMEYDDRLLEQNVEAAREALPPEQFLDDDLLNDWLWNNGRLDEAHLIGWSYTQDEKPVRELPYALKRDVILTGADINDAGVSWDQNQQPVVSMKFKPHGAQVFCEVSSANVGKQFAIMLDDRVSSAPSIREKICGGSAQIEMSSSPDPQADAQTLALVLRTGSLDAPVVVGEVRNVGAQLGRDSIRQGTTAALIGSLLVMIYMTVWYKTSGIIANLALFANVLMILAALALFGATLTLPGIAGIALTIGMAVDANIIIYERIREELKTGSSARKAVDAGFENATTAILDSNITTAIAGIVLYTYGTGPIRGFAVTLLVGIATTLISALYVTRSLLEFATRSSTTRLSI